MTYSTICCQTTGERATSTSCWMLQEERREQVGAAAAAVYPAHLPSDQAQGGPRCRRAVHRIDCPLLRDGQLPADTDRDRRGVDHSEHLRRRPALGSLP